MNAVKDALLSPGGNSMMGAQSPAGDMVFGMATAGTGLFDNKCCNLSRRTRFMGFVGCFCLGFLISCLSTLALYTGKINQFAIWYTLGNVIAMMSTAFLMGPWSQLKAMVHAKRRIATALYFITLSATLAVAFGVPQYSDAAGTVPTPGKSMGIIVLVILQFCALVWYTASYIPFARDLIVKAGGWVKSAVIG